MVICTYFVNNMCRFGPKCNNEHVNVRLILKTDAEAVLKGNQWILSGYSPFKDKPCVPNLIDDQCFEEVRLMAYEAKNNGTLQNVSQQLGQNINDAKQKMNLLMNPSNDILSLVINMYNGTDTGSMPSAGANPYSTNPMTNTQQNSTNIFGSGANTASVFGSSQPNPFSSNASGFGGSNQPTTNLFGGGSSATNSNSVFGGGSNTIVNAGNMFGGSSTFGNAGQSGYGAQASQPSVFGASANVNANAGPFSQGATSAGAGPFSQSASIFGGGAQSNPVFGGPPSFGSKSSGLFGQSSTTQPNNQAGSVFGQSAQPFGATNTQTSSIFGGVSQAPNQSSFGQQQQSQAQGNIFGGVNTAPTPNLFGNSASETMASGSVFGSAHQPQQQTANNMFGAPPPPFQQQQQQPQHQHQVSPFGGNAASNNMFGMNTGQASSAPSLQEQQQSIFGGAAINSKAIQSQSPFGGSQPFGQPQFQQQQVQQQQQQQQQPSQGFQSTFQEVPSTQSSAQATDYISKFYSQLSDFTEQEIESLKANIFELGKIPTKPPPRELCV